MFASHIFFSRSVWVHICVPLYVCKTILHWCRPIIVFYVSRNIQKLYLIIPSIAMALTFAPIPCLALQSMRHLMKAALHDAIKEQGSFLEVVQTREENSACLVGWFRANCKSDSQRIYNSSSYSCIAARNNCSTQ